MLPAGTITSALLAKKFPRLVVHVSKRNENLKNSEPVLTVRSERLDCADLFVFGMRDEKAKKAILGSIEVKNERLKDLERLGSPSVVHSDCTRYLE